MRSNHLTCRWFSGRGSYGGTDGSWFRVSYDACAVTILPADGLLVEGLLAALMAGGSSGLVPHLGLPVPFHDDPAA